MKTAAAVVLAFFAYVCSAAAQYAPPVFPPNTVFGRLNPGSPDGQGQAIPFATLAQQLGGLTGPSNTVNDLISGAGGTALVDSGVSINAIPTGMINVMGAAYGAKGNTLSFGDGTVAASSSAFSSNAATFTANDVGKSIVVDQGTVSGALVTTISGFTDSHHVTLAASASASVPFFYNSGDSVTAAGTGCAPGDTINFSGGTSTTTAVAKVTHCTVVSATINAAGASGKADNGTTSGTCVVHGTTGAGGVPFSLTVTLTTGAVTSIGAFAQPSVGGQYSTNPTSLAAEPVTGCNGLTGATLSLTMGVKNLNPQTAGVYSVKPTNPVSQGTASGSEAGVTWSAFWVTAGSFTYGTDDTTALSAAINASITAWQSGKPTCVLFPAGAYFVSSPMPTFNNNGGVPGCLQGQERRKSIIYVSPALNGDVFSWSRTLNFNQDPLNGPSEVFGTANQGARVSDLIVLGDRLTANTQNAFTFYDENQTVYFNNVEGGYLNGSFLKTGYTKNSTNAYMAESWFTNLRCFSCGSKSGSVGVIDINEVNGGGAQAPNEIRFDTVDIYAPYNVGAWIHAGGAYFKKLRIEGLQWASGGNNTDLFEIGDPSESFQVSATSCLDCEMIDSYPGAAALHITAANSGLAPFGIRYDGSFGGGANLGRAIQIDFGRTSEIHVLTSLPTADYSVQASASAGSDIDIWTQNGEESLWSYNLNGNNNIGVGRVMRRGANSSAQVVAANHDGTAAGGNGVGAGAVDLSVTRTANTQVASGTNATIGGGSGNTANANFSTVVGGEGNSSTGTDSVSGGNSNVSSGGQSVVAGGFTNTAAGTNGWIPGGKSGTDRGRYGTGCASSGQSQGADFNGDSQHCWMILHGTGASTSAVRLTGDLGAANSANCINIPNNAAFALTVDVMAFDRTTVTKNESWNQWAGLLTRGANAASTALTMNSTPTPITNGTVTGSSISATADTANGCVNLSFTPPTSNTDTWDVTARVNTVEVQ